MKKEIIQESKDTVIVFTYKYVWQTKDGKLCVKYLTEPLQGHDEFMKRIKEDSMIKAAYREYVSQVDFAYLGVTETFKTKKKEENKDEKV